MSSKQDVIAQYGCTEAELNDRILNFTGFTGETDEAIAIGFLKKADLDVSTAVNYFFDGAPASRPGSPPTGEASGAVSSTNTSREEPAPAPAKKKEFANEETSEDDDMDVDLPPAGKRRRKPVKVDLDLCDLDSSTSDSPVPPRRKRKKRGPPSDPVELPQRKKRKTKPPPKKRAVLDDGDSSDGEDAQLVFTKPDMSEDEVDEDEKEPIGGAVIFDDLEEYTPEKVDLEWERKLLGEVKIKFTRDANDHVDFFRTCQTIQQGLNADAIKLKSSKEDKPLLDEIINGERSKSLHVWISKTVVADEEKSDDKIETVEAKFFLYVVQQTAANGTSQLDKILTRVGGATEEIKADCKAADALGDRFKKRKLKLSYDGILDFSQKFETTEEEEKAFDAYPDQRHGLYKITLNKYQHQSIHAMIQEERSPQGIQRHFWTRMTFSSGDPYWYSPYFKTIRFEPPKPSRGGMLCEEMGLGKTIEMLALCNTMKPLTVKQPYVDQQTKQKRFPSGATLIVAPTSLVGQWDQEIKDRHKKKPTTLCYYGSKRPKDPKKIAGYDFVLTTYGIIKHKKEREMETLQKIDWHRVILDESHSIKAHNTEQTRQCLNFRAKTRWCLTGTPFVSTLKDARCQFNFLRIGDPMERQVYWDKAVKSLTSGKHEELTSVFRAFDKLVLRHKKDQNFNGEPIVTLPPKREEFLPVQMTGKQIKLYHLLFDIAKKQYDDFKRRGEVSRNTLKIMSLMRPIRKACSGGEFNVKECEQKLQEITDRVTHHAAPGGGSAAQRAGAGNLNHAVAEEEAYNSADSECPICLELIEEPLQTPCRHIFCGDCIRSTLNTAVREPKCPVCRKPCQVRQLQKPKGAEEQEKKHKAPKEGKISGIAQIVMDTKLKTLVNELERIRREKPKEKALVFTTFASTLEWLKKELKKRGFQHRTIKGSHTMEQRRKALTSFQKDPPTTVFLLSVRSGAVGITLTAAQHVFMLEPCANIALYRQAVNRVYRLGQTKSVHIRTFYMANTIEESLVKVNEKKNASDFAAGNIACDKAAMRSEEFDLLFKDYRKT